jgi:hypothetical protein
VLDERIAGTRDGNHSGGRSQDMEATHGTGRMRRLVGVVIFALVLATGTLGATAGSTAASALNVDRLDRGVAGSAVVASDPVRDPRPVAIRRYLHPRIGFAAE